MKLFQLSVLLIFLLLSSCGINNSKYDWPQYRNDAGRTGYTSQQLTDNPGIKWIHHFPSPEKSWTGVHTRMTFDHSCHPVISGRYLYIGSSADNKIYALETKSGKTAWTFYTDGPVRFAPAIYKDRLYAVSDDGFIYCLSAKNGKLIWKKNGAQRKDMILGNEKMISRWPARGGLVIKDDVIYYGAGIWPSEKIFIYALDPDSGEVLWVNDSCGDIEMPQPHGGAVAKSGLSAQGYFCVAGNNLFVPTGRAVPAALDIQSGELKYFHLQLYRNLGGSEIMAVDSFIFIPSGNTRDMYEVAGTSYSVFSSSDGHIIPGELKSSAVAISPDYIYCINNDTHKIEAYQNENLINYRETVDRRGNNITVRNLSDPVWSAGILKDNVKTMIATGNRLIAGTETEKILIFDISNGRLISSVRVNGLPLGLAVAGNKLFVSTSKGSVYCLAGNYKGDPEVHMNDYPRFDFIPDEIFVDAVDEIISKSDIKNGYCLDLQCGDGSLIYELIKKTNLKIVALDSEEKNVISARKKLSDAGFYGSRAVIFHGDIGNVALPEYFANLIISQESLNSGALNETPANITRCQRPYGGVIITGEPGNMKVNIRGELEGAGEWTHQYHDPANTTVSEDEIIDGKLEILWFKDSDFEMPSRHGRGVAPLFKDGRLFVEGLNAIRAIDAYNGNLLWEYPIDNLMTAYDQEHINGASITHGNWCIEGDKLFVRRGISMYNRSAKDCYVLDTKTGSRIGTYQTPEGYWGYIAVKNGILYGSVANEEHIVTWGYRESDMFGQFSESSSLFAIDLSTDSILWQYKASHSIRHNTIAIGNDILYFIDRPVAEMDYIYRRGIEKEHPTGTLVALDSKTGRPIYKNRDNIWGTLLILNEEHNKIIMSYSDTRYKLPSEKGGKIAVLDATTGRKLWESETRKNLPEYFASSSMSRPLVNDSIIFFEPETFDLESGQVLDNNFQRSYGCGIISGSKKMLLFRSATVGYYWFDNIDAGIQNYGGIRPGCWINTIPAGGLVLMPDATSRCDCSYLIKSWVALKPSYNL